MLETGIMPIFRDVFRRTFCKIAFQFKCIILSFAMYQIKTELEKNKVNTTRNKIVLPQNG